MSYPSNALAAHWYENLDWALESTADQSSLIDSWGSLPLLKILKIPPSTTHKCEGLLK
jgi:hypothetical protein